MTDFQKICVRNLKLTKQFHDRLRSMLNFQAASVSYQKNSVEKSFLSRNCYISFFARYNSGMKWLAVLSIMTVSALPQTGEARITDVFCDDTARLHQQLSTQPGLRKHGQGLRGPDTLLEVWIANKTGEWTLVQSYANGTSCIIAMGENWMDLAPAADPA